MLKKKQILLELSRNTKEKMREGFWKWVANMRAKDISDRM